MIFLISSSPQTSTWPPISHLLVMKVFAVNEYEFINESSLQISVVETFIVIPVEKWFDFSYSMKGV